jgi:CheY-like chemotaxis protein
MARLLLVQHPDAPELGGWSAASLAWSHQTTRVPHGLEALRLLAEGGYDAVIVQVRAVAKDGTALARIIRERPSNGQLRLIALVDEISLREQALLRAAGFDQVLTTPCPPAMLARALEVSLASDYRMPSLLEAYAQVETLMRRERAALAPVVRTELARRRPDPTRRWLN